MLYSFTTQGTSADHSTVDTLDDPNDGEEEPLSRPWDSSDPFISASTRILMQRVLKCYVRQVIVFIGIPGNALCCVVFFKHGLLDKINLLLFWLAAADLATLMVQLLLMPGCYLVDAIHLNNWAVIGNGKVGFVNWWTSHVSGMLVVVVSVDRCLSVALPFKAKTLLNYRAMVTAVVMSYLVPLAYFLPCFLAITVKWSVDPSTNRSLAYIDDTDWFPLDRKGAVSIWNRFSLVFRPILLIIMVVCCTVTVVCLRRASRHREQMVGTTKVEGDTRDRRITKMLLFICIIYIVLLLPDICSNFVLNFVPEYFAFGKYHNTHIIVYQFLWIASCMNSSANFFVYIVLSSRFQTTLKGLLCFCSKRQLNV